MALARIDALAVVGRGGTAGPGLGGGWGVGAGPGAGGTSGAGRGPGPGGRGRTAGPELAGSSALGSEPGPGHTAGPARARAPVRSGVPESRWAAAQMRPVVRRAGTQLTAEAGQQRAPGARPSEIPADLVA